MSFNQIIVQSSSPTFCNIKPGNIFFVKNEKLVLVHHAESEWTENGVGN